MSDSVWPHRRQPTRLPHPWDSPGKNTGVGCHSVLQGIFPTQGLNPVLSHCRRVLYHLSHQGNICCCSVNQLCPTLWLNELRHARLPCPSPSARVCSDSCLLSRWCHPTISCPLSLLLLSSIFPSIRVFSNELALRIRWPKFWSFSFSISSFSECSRLISFRIDWSDLLAVQGTLKSLLQLHSLKASVLQCSAFFMVPLSHPYMTTGKTIALIKWTFGLSKRN